MAISDVIPTVDDEGRLPDMDAVDTQTLLDAALQYALYLDLDSTNEIQITAAWTRVIALVALNEGP